jgi:hypothetical protein
VENVGGVRLGGENRERVLAVVSERPGVRAAEVSAANRDRTADGGRHAETSGRRV